MIDYRTNSKTQLADWFTDRVDKVLFDAMTQPDMMSVGIVPNFYELRLWWRRLWPLARRREKLALMTAIMTDAFAFEPIARVAQSRFRKHGILGLTADRYQRFGEAFVRDIVPVTFTQKAPGYVGEFDPMPSGPNRVAVFADGRTYAYRVD